MNGKIVNELDLSNDLILKSYQSWPNPVILLILAILIL